MTKETLFQKVQAEESLCQDVARFLWNHPEVGGEEAKSAAYLREILKKEGFTIVNGDRLEHSFYAEYGSGKPVIGLLAEYTRCPVCPRLSPPRSAPWWKALPAMAAATI